MGKKIIQTEGAPKAIGPYSQAVQQGNMIFLSGQLPVNSATGKIEEDTIEGQTHQVLKNIRTIMESQGLSLDNIVKTTVFLKDINNFKAFNEVYATYFTQNFPARSTIEVAALPLGAKIEIESIAII